MIFFYFLKNIYSPDDEITTKIEAPKATAKGK